MQLVKPNTDYFEYVLKELLIDLQKAVFIDDNLKNVVAAQSVGIPSFCFETVTQLWDELKQHELI